MVHVWLIMKDSLSLSLSQKQVSSLFFKAIYIMTSLVQKWKQAYIALIPMLENRVYTSIGSCILLFHAISYASIAWTTIVHGGYLKRKSHRIEPKDMIARMMERKNILYFSWVYIWGRLHPFVTHSHVTYNHNKRD